MISSEYSFQISRTKEFPSSTNQCTKVIDRASFDLDYIKITTSAIVTYDSQRKQDAFLAESWLDERRLTDHDRLSISMLHLIGTHRINIIEYIRVIYEQKIEFLLEIPIL